MVLISGGGGSPLDLQYIEKDICGTGHDGSLPVCECIYCTAAKLLTLLRETRAALRPFVEMGRVEGKFLTARPDGNTAVIIVNLGAFRRAAAVLAQATDQTKE